jgi:Fe-S-cluster containining protein
MTGIVLRKHRMRHIPGLRIGHELVEKRFMPGCSMSKCNADCCSGGVYADTAEREEILRHADLIRSQMDPGQEHDAARWFEADPIHDVDYPSGRAIGTEVYDERCVFLNREGMCVLQKAAAAAVMDRYALKPLFCWLYPITIDNGELTLHDPGYAERPECCSYRDEGPLTVFEVCAEELTLALGSEGVEELRGELRRAVVPGRLEG